MNPAVIYRVMETFLTLQGEGYHQGRSACFVRLGGCDVGCSWCDVKESWVAEKHPGLLLSELVDKVKESGAPICVITGGEPLMYDLGALTSSLRELGIKTHLETSGAWPLSGTWDWICISPKRFKLPLEEVLSMANEYKVVIHHPNDIRFAERFTSLLQPDCRLYLQPEWDVREDILPSILEYIHAHPEWSLGIQSHKYIHVP